MMSITKRLLSVYLLSTFSILALITTLVYPPLYDLMVHISAQHVTNDYLLAKVCIQYFFIALWAAVGISGFVSYYIIKRSLSPVKKFSEQLNLVCASSLDKRLIEADYPRELKQLALTCNNMLERIERAFQQMKQFSAGMAHELRNPIHYLKTATEVTLSRSNDLEAYQHLLEKHLDEYQNLTQLIDNLLLLSRAENGQLHPNYEPQSAKALVDTIMDYYQYIATENKVKITSVGDATIHVDSTLFKRVLTNLIDNSLMHTPEKGTITLAIQQIDESVQITVKDTGKGIPKDALPNVTQSFYRLATPHQEGLGLGLAICQSIMDSHGGTMKIDSDIGSGTIVTLTLRSQQL
ncbi:MAG: ATP-binding protein [Legionellaceae bacterium]|nr:ATP-binding protein [Legionellaceae bacterium]